MNELNEFNNLKKIKFLSEKSFVNFLNTSNLNFEIHNILFLTHIASLLYLTKGIAYFNIDLKYVLLISKEQDKLKINYDSISIVTTKNSLIELNNYSTRSNFKLNNNLFGKLNCYDFKIKIIEYLKENLKYDNMDLESYRNTNFLKFNIKVNRKDSMTNFLENLNNNNFLENFLTNYDLVKGESINKKCINYNIKKIKI